MNIYDERIGPIKKKTSDLKEIHTDGGYGSQQMDQTMEQEEFLPLSSAVKGRESQVQKTIEKSWDDSETYLVSCPFHTVESAPTKKKTKAVFDTSICKIIVT